MKTLSKILAVILSISILLSFPVHAFATTKTGSIFTSSTYTHQSQFDNCKIYQGVDLSKHNGTVNFAKMKKAGVKYVILRAGYRGYATEGTLNKDIKFDEYIAAAAKQGLDIGIYFYSQAITETEAKNEAKKTVSIIKKYKKYINLPVAFDYEFAETSKGRFDSAWKSGKLNKKKCTKIAKAFCEQIKSSGYEPMIYANKSFLNTVIDGKALGKTYPIWLAHYITKTDYDGTYYIWQYSSKGTVNGVEGYVDSNFLYSGSEIEAKVFTAGKIADVAYTGSKTTPKFDVKFDGETLVKGEDYYVTFKNNIEIGTASVTVTGCNDYENVPKAVFTYKIVPTKAATPVLTKRKATSLEVKWDAHENADGYRVSYSENGKHVTLATTTKTEAVLDNLSPAKNYSLIVQAYKTVDKTKYFGIASDELKTCTKPSKVTGIKTDKRSDTYIKLKWDKQNNADKYIVYKYNADKKEFNEYKQVKSNTVKVKDLKGDKKYKFKVKAVKENEKGKTMNGKNSSAFSDYTSPCAPKLKSASSNAYKRLTANHSKVKKVTGYQVKWSTTSSFKQNFKTKKFKGADNLKNTVKTYRSGGSYYVKVRAYKVRNGVTYYSPWSDSAHVYTK